MRNRTTPVILLMLLAVPATLDAAKPAASQTVALKCLIVTSQCAVCDDGTLWAPGALTKKGQKRKGAPLKLGSYACVNSGEMKLGKSDEMTTVVQGKKCMRLRPYCAVCEDDKFYSPKTQHELTTDLFECATHPRTTLYSQ